MIRVAIVGATGYTALESALILARHPGAQLTIATSRSEVGESLASVHPKLIGKTDVVISEFEAAAIAEQSDVTFCCLPHGASAETVHQLIDAGTRVVDFSADFRLLDRAVYEQWYGVIHPWPQRIGSVVYGLPEFYADQIAAADIVANPGCYPTSAILPLVPVVRDGLVDPADIVVDSKSGVSGAGRGGKTSTSYCEVNESIAAYSVGKHRHAPEIDDLVTRIAGVAVQTIFTPHLTPMNRGILSTIYVRPAGESIDAAAVRKSLLHQYRDSAFVHIVDGMPATGHVAGTNAVHIGVADSGVGLNRRIVIVSAIDNLIKGASGAAVQNMNVMFGLEQHAGLEI